MSDRAKIVLGLLVLIVPATAPIWYSIAVEDAATPPKLEMPAGETACVESKDFMAAHHMQLLDEWRVAVVREDERTYTSKTYGVTYEMSLTGTCLRCHADRETFCNRCHDYVDVDPYCWDCHVDPKGR